MKQWVIALDDQGVVDFIREVTVTNEDLIFHKLNGTVPFDLSFLNFLELRSRFNTHRNYRVIRIGIPLLSEKEIVNKLEENEQFRRLILEKGVEL